MLYGNHRFITKVAEYREKRLQPPHRRPIKVGQDGFFPTRILRKRAAHPAAKPVSGESAPLARTSYGRVTNLPRKLRADAVSMRYVLSVALHTASPVTVIDATMSVSAPSRWIKCGPPESP